MPDERLILDEEEPQEHVIHMWSPFSLSIDKGYDYLRAGALYRAGYAVVKVIAAAILTAINKIFFGLRIEGRENIFKISGVGAVTVCNHVHPMDCTMIACAMWYRRQYFITLQSNLEIPVIRHIIRTLGGVPIPRELKHMRDFSTAMNDALKAGKLVQVYPERILCPYYKRIRSFKNGAFSLAYDSNVPVLPMAITYREPKGFLGLIKQKPCMTLNILPPVYPKVGDDKRSEVLRLKDVCRSAISECFNENSIDF